MIDVMIAAMAGLCTGWGLASIPQPIRVPLGKRKAIEDRAEQLEVQLAGCGVIALGHGLRGYPESHAKPGDYGYSASYQDVLDLRRRFERALVYLTADQRDMVFAPLGPLPSASAGAK